MSVPFESRGRIPNPAVKSELERLARELEQALISRLAQQFEEFATELVSLMPATSPWLECKAACAYLGFSPDRLYKLTAARAVPCRKKDGGQGHFFNRSAEPLEDAGIKTIDFLQASGPMAHAYQGFYQLALEGKLAHDGDPVFATHIEANAASKSERGWKLRKLHNKKRIDATVAAALARHQRKRKTSIYWMEP